MINHVLPLTMDWVLPMAMKLPMESAMGLWWLGFKNEIIAKNGNGNGIANAIAMSTLLQLTVP